MSISKGIRKAATAAKAQSRGLQGKRNSQGDFAQAMPEDVQTKGVQDAVNPDIQNYVNDVKSQIDEIEAELSAIDTNVDTPGMTEEIQRLEQAKFDLVDGLLERLQEEGIEPPAEIVRMKTELLNPAAYDDFN